MADMNNLIYEEQSYQLRGAIYEVFKRLGPGWDEDTYHEATKEALKETRIPFDTKVRKIVTHKGVEVDRFECDLIAWDLIILELKVLPYTTFAPIHYAQLTHYLKTWNKRLGLLVNFGGLKANIERVLWKNNEWELVENYSAFDLFPLSKYQASREFLRGFALLIGEKFGLGYPELTYRSLFFVETNDQSVECQKNLTFPARWNDNLIGQFKSDHFLLNQDCIVNIRALLEYPPRYDFARMKTYLRSYGLKIGFILNFGKRNIQIYGVNAEWYQGT